MGVRDEPAGLKQAFGLVAPQMRFCDEPFFGGPEAGTAEILLRSAIQRHCNPFCELLGRFKEAGRSDWVDARIVPGALSYAAGHGVQTPTVNIALQTALSGDFWESVANNALIRRAVLELSEDPLPRDADLAALAAQARAGQRFAVDDFMADTMTPAEHVDRLRVLEGAINGQLAFVKFDWKFTQRRTDYDPYARAIRQIAP